MRTETLKVDGMTCGGCVSAVTKALKSVGGVGDVDVSLERGEASVEFDESSASPESLRTAVRQAGYEVGVRGSKSQAKGGCCG